jgi:hypothetical protein
VESITTTHLEQPYNYYGSFKCLNRLLARLSRAHRVVLTRALGAGSAMPARIDRTGRSRNRASDFVLPMATAFLCQIIADCIIQACESASTAATVTYNGQRFRLAVTNAENGETRKGYHCKFVVMNVSTAVDFRPELRFVPCSRLTFSKAAGQNRLPGRHLVFCRN